MCYERELIEQTKKRFFMYLNSKNNLSTPDKILIKRFFEYRVNIANIKNIAALSNLILYKVVVNNQIDKKQSCNIICREKLSKLYQFKIKKMKKIIWISTGFLIWVASLFLFVESNVIYYRFDLSFMNEFFGFYETFFYLFLFTLALTLQILSFYFAFVIVSVQIKK